MLRWRVVFRIPSDRGETWGVAFESAETPEAATAAVLARHAGATLYEITHDVRDPLLRVTVTPKAHP